MGDEHTITGEIRPYDMDGDAVVMFAMFMMEKLRQNSHKAHWSTVDHKYLLRRVHNEYIELMGALSDLYSSKDPIKNEVELREAIIRECADVANFAMMIADNEQTKLEEME